MPCSALGFARARTFTPLRDHRPRSRRRRGRHPHPANRGPRCVGDFEPSPTPRGRPVRPGRRGSLFQVHRLADQGQYPPSGARHRSNCPASPERGRAHFKVGKRRELTRLRTRPEADGRRLPNGSACRRNNSPRRRVPSGSRAPTPPHWPGESMKSKSHRNRSSS